MKKKGTSNACEHLSTNYFKRRQEHVILQACQQTNMVATAKQKWCSSENNFFYIVPVKWGLFSGQDGEASQEQTELRKHTAEDLCCY